MSDKGRLTNHCSRYAKPDILHLHQNTSSTEATSAWPWDETRHEEFTDNFRLKSCYDQSHHALSCSSWPTWICQLSVLCFTCISISLKCHLEMCQLPEWLQEKISGIQSNGNQPEDTLSRYIRNALYISVGLPLVVQIIGSAYRDEVVLRVTREIEAGADYYQDKWDYKWKGL